MALPAVTVTVVDGGLGISPPSPANTSCTVGVCSSGIVGTVYLESDLTTAMNTLGQGPGVEALLLKLATAGSAHYFLPVNPSVAGASTAVTFTGSGFGTITVSHAPAQTITIACTTTGTIDAGTAKFTFALGSGPASLPVTSVSPAPWAYLVPGTLTTVTFPAGTYDSGDTWTISTLGVVTAGGGNQGVTNPTQVSSPLDNYQVTVTPVVSGTAGTGTFTYSLDNGNTTSPEVTIPSGGVYQIPNTGVVLTFAQPTIVITILAAHGGALGTMQFSWAVNGGGATNVTNTTANSGVNFTFTVPSTGATLTFAPGTYVATSTYSVSAVNVITLGGGAINTVTSSSVAFNKADTYKWTSGTAGFTAADVTAAFTTLFASTATFAFVHVVGTPSSAANASSLASTVDTQLSAAATSTNPRYLRGMVECPSVGSVINASGTVSADTADTDAVISAAFTTFLSNRVAVGVGDADTVSLSTNARIVRRNAAWAIMARACQASLAEDLSSVGRGTYASVPLSYVRALYRDEATATTSLDAARFSTLRSFGGLTGYFVTNCRLMSSATSDFQFWHTGRVVDEACRIARIAILNFLNGNVRVNSTTGYIDERDAQRFENFVDGKLRDGLLNLTPPAVSDPGNGNKMVSISRTTNILSTNNAPVTIRVIPLGYLKQIPVSVGLKNPAFTA